MHFINDPAIWLKQLLIDSGMSYNLSSVLSTTALVLIVLFLSWLSNLIAKSIILKIVTIIVRRTASTWDDVFLEQNVFTRLSHFAPALVIWFMAGWALKAYPGWLDAVRKLTYIYMVVAGTAVVIAFIESWHKIYLTLPISKHRTIKGYVQVVKLFVIIIAVLVVISVVFKKEVGALIAGLGAMAAVLSLIFKDAILGLVASIQLSANNMVKVGDWITIPSRGADGVVEDITLTTVKIRNFDRTIITVPVYSLVNESFQNWKGMEESGVRQIKRAIFIDMRSIKFPEQRLIEKLSVIPLMKEHFGAPEKENKPSARLKNKKEGVLKGSDDLTNLGLFRIYAESYLKNHPLIDKKQTLLVRHREPEGNGLPLQVYAFSKNNSWLPFENLQSEIIEHLLALLTEFELKVFQRPTGDDIKTISGTN
jgi:miniconductance mechanosensitive channel